MADTEVVRSQLYGLWRQNGRLTPADVVDAARSEDSPLHPLFEWDDSIAAERYREDQARAIIRTIKIRFVDDTGDPARVNEFVSVARSNGRSYVPLPEIKTDPITARIVLRQAEREWQALMRRYGHLGEFLDLVRRDIAN